MLQTVLVFAVFAVAVIYVGRSIYRNFQARSSCGTGCGKCGVVDLRKIPQKVQEKNLLS